jgi:hypothetical protein
VVSSASINAINILNGAPVTTGALFFAFVGVITNKTRAYVNLSSPLLVLSPTKRVLM